MIKIPDENNWSLTSTMVWRSKFPMRTLVASNEVSTTQGTVLWVLQMQLPSPMSQPLIPSKKGIGNRENPALFPCRSPPKPAITACLPRSSTEPVPPRGLRHCGRRRQERHSISASTPSRISTVTPSPMIASLVGRFMIKTLHEKGPGLLPGRRTHLVGGP